MPHSSRLLTGILYLWMSLCPFHLTAQTQLKYEKLSSQNGLSSNSVADIIQDSYGFIWIATSNGLNRYDGYEIKQYLPVLNDSTSISGSSIITVYEDKERNIWVGTLGNGLNLFDRKTETFRRFVHRQGDSTSISDNSFVGFQLMLEDHTGNFWVGTDNGLNILDRKTYTFRRVPIGTDLNQKTVIEDYLRGMADTRAANRIRGIYEDHKMNLWVGTDWGGLYKYNYDTGKFTGYYPEPGNATSIAFTTPGDFAEDDAGNMWILNYWNGIDKLDLTNGKFQRFPNDSYDPGALFANIPLNNFFLDNKMLWIGTNSGLFTFNTIDYTLQYVNPVNSDFQGYIAPLLVDQQGNHWLSNAQSILIVNNFHQGFQKYTHHDDDPKSIAAKPNGINVDSKGVVYVINATSVDVLNEKKQKVKTLNFSPSSSIDLSKENLNCMYEDQSGNIFFVGLRPYRLNTHSQSLEILFPTGESPALGWTADMYQDEENNFWFGGGCLAVYNSKYNEYDRYYANGEGNFAMNAIYSMLPVGHDQILLGGAWDGLLLFNKKERKFGRHFSMGEQKGQEGTTVQISKIFRSHDQKIWLGSNYGLALFDLEKGTFKNYGPQEGLPSNAVNCILEDDHQHLWLSTTNGLSRFDPANETFRNYDYHDGLQGNEFNSLQAAFKSPKTKELWFLGTNGLSVFNPDSLRENTYIPPVIFTKLIYYNPKKNLGQAITDNTVYSTDKLRFSYSDNIIEFHFAALNFISPEKNTYAYRLSGFNNDWVNLGTRHEVSFSNLNPGTYTLQVKAANNDGVWNEQGASLAIIIFPPWWRTWWAYSIYGLLFLSFLWRLHIYQRQRTIRIERERTQQKELLQAREIEKAYAELKATQAQLIQSEKMASLGEMTAGIAHEIQNPLNFVNNFAEVNSELIGEMKQNLDEGKQDDAKTIANDIDDNEQKIIFHGKRADAIVKSMLQHSRTSSGVKEPTDINALVDEYLRLAYHGLRAKDKSFNATMKTDFDPNIGLINIVPQDIGRVILNLITNAFYAVASTPPLPPMGGKKYEPTVTVTTKRHLPPTGGKGGEGDIVEIRVSDNGPGIPDAIKDKIFQPFYTTKPAGQGTGLGLSLSYDIIKAHGGELKVETREGDGSSFIVVLPLI